MDTLLNNLDQIVLVGSMLIVVAMLIITLFHERKQTENLVDLVLDFQKNMKPDQRDFLSGQFEKLSPARKRVISMVLSAAEYGASLTPTEDDDLMIQQLRYIIGDVPAQEVKSTGELQKIPAEDIQVAKFKAEIATIGSDSDA